MQQNRLALMAKKDNYLRIEDVLNAIQRFIKYLLRQQKWIWGTALIFGLLAGLYGILKKPSYLGKGSFILEEKAVGGGLSGLASQFGIDIGSIMGGNTNIFTGDNVIDILKSKKIVEQVLLSPIDSTNTLADHYLDFMNWKNKYPEMKDLHFKSNTNQVLKDSVLQLMHEKIVEEQVTVDRINKKGSIIEIQTLSGSQLFSKLFTERLLDATLNMYTAIKTSAAQANVDRLQKRADSLVRVMNVKTYQTATEQVLDANIAFKTTAVPAEITGKEKMLVFTLYSEVIKNLEVAKMALVNQTPIMQKLDTPSYPLKNINKAWWKWMAIGAGIGFGIAFFILFYSYPGTKNEQN